MNRRRGFSLIEVLVVLAIAGVLLGLLLRNMNRGKANREVDRVAVELEGGLRLARATALNRSGAHVVLNANEWILRAPNSGPIGDVKKGAIPVTVEVTMVPNAANLTFNSNGSVTAAANITVRSRATNRTTVLSIGQATGAVQSTQTVF